MAPVLRAFLLLNILTWLWAGAVFLMSVRDEHIKCIMLFTFLFDLIFHSLRKPFVVVFFSHPVGLYCERGM